MPSQYSPYTSFSSGQYRGDAAPMTDPAQMFPSLSSYGDYGSFTKRPDTLSAGVPSMSDYLTGAGKSFSSGDIWGGVKDIGNGMGQAVQDFLPSGFLGTTDTNTGMKTDGWGGTALGIANGLMSGYMGMKQYGLSKDIFENNKSQFERQYAANKTLTNGRLEDRQQARVASNAGAYQSVSDYMKKNGVA